MIKTAIVSAGLITLLLNILTLTCSFFLGKIFNLNKEDTITIMIEGGIQNASLAFVIVKASLFFIQFKNQLFLDYEKKQIYRSSNCIYASRV